jgi:thymidine kinase
MAKLHFTHAAMNAGKSSLLLQTNFNYGERGMRCMLLTAAFDTRSGKGKIASRLGMSAEAHTFMANTDLTPLLQEAADAGVACVLVDEAQFLSRAQVGQLCWAVDNLGLPVMAYGLRTDFQGHLFEGSAALMALADEIREARTICHCGKKATMVLRKDAQGKAILDGPQVQIGGNESYESVCRKHWQEAHSAQGVHAPLAT